MKANELMVDDYVRIKSTKQIIKLTEIDSAYDEVSYFDGEAEGELTIKLSNIEPIEFTPEILEKNGFVMEDGYCHGTVYSYQDTDGSCHMVFHPKEYNYTHGAYSYINITHGCVCIDELPINFVHELQHVLKLCGIEKTIEL